MLKKPKTLEELYLYLSRYRLFDVLELVTNINTVFKYGATAEDLHYEGIGFEMFQWIKYMNIQQRINLYFSSTRLARFILLSGANNDSNNRVTFKSQVFRNMLDYSMDLYDKDVEKFDKDFITPHILGKVSHWQFPLQESCPKLIGRANLLFLEIPNELSLSYDIDSKFQSYFGLSVKTYLGIGTLMWHKSDGYIYRDMDIDDKLGFMTKGSYMKFLGLTSMNYDEYKRYFGRKPNGIDKKLEIYGVDPLKHKPLIYYDENTYIVPQMKYFFDKVTQGIFHLLSDMERGTKEGDNLFRVAFGEILKAYVGKFLISNNDTVRSFDLDEVILDYKGKIPDYALISNGICLLIEVKLSLTNMGTRSRVEKNDIVKTIKSGGLDKALQQISEFTDFVVCTDHVDDSIFYNVKKVVSLIVSYEDLFVSNLAFLELIEKERGIKLNLQICNVSELESLGGILYSGVDVVKILYENAISDKKCEPVASCVDMYQENLSSTVIDSSKERFFDKLIY